MGQKQQLIWDLPPIESFYLNASIYDLDKFEAKKRIKKLSEMLEIDEELFIPVRKLSLGQRMKSELLAALIHEPNILFLDEPTLGLDINVQRNLRKFLQKYNKETNATICLTSHYMKDIQEMCERVFVLNKGNAVYDGNFNKLIKNINPERKLIFEFIDMPKDNFINSLQETFPFNINEKLLTAMLPESDLQQLLKILLRNHTANNISFEDLPIDDSMKSFFQNPNKYIK